jgi:type II secretory pathway pseudopilin PulG
MVLEVLIGLLLVAGVGATILSFFVVRSSKARAKAEPVANHDVDNPQRDIKQD